MFLEIFFVGLVLSADSFSAALAMGFKSFTKKDAMKFAFTSGFAEGFVAYLGAIAGVQIVKNFSAYDHWIAFILLLAVAFHMAYEGFEQIRDHKKNTDNEKFHSIIKIIIVSFATSLDAFGVGVSLGVSQKPIIPFIISIGLWAFASTIIGLNIAQKLSKRFGAYVSFFGAVVLAFMAFKMLEI